MQARTALWFLALGDILYAGTPAFHREQVLCVCRDSHSFSVAVLCSSANATPEFEGRGGDDLGTEIANTLYRIFNNKSSVDLQSLCISPREHCWVLCVDVLVSHRVSSPVLHHLCWRPNGFFPPSTVPPHGEVFLGKRWSPVIILYLQDKYKTLINGTHNTIL